MWLHARDDRSNVYRPQLSSSGDLSVFAPLVRNDLIAADVLPQGFEKNLAAGGLVWAAALSPFMGRIVGCVLLRHASVVTPLSSLTQQQRLVKNFWLTSEWRASVPVLCQVAFAARIEPQVAEPLNACQPRSGLFWRATGFSADRFLKAAILGSAIPTVGDALQQLGAQQLLEGASKDMVLSLPASHCLLLAAGRWQSYVFPIPHNRYVRARLGCTLVRDLWGLLQLPGADDARAAEDFNPSDSGALTRLGDCLRRCHAHLAADRGAPEHLTQEVASLVGALDAHQNRLIEDLACRSQSYYDVEFLLHCIVFSGTLRSSCLFQEALRSAVRIAVASTDAQSHLLQFLDTPAGKPPSKTVLYKHRFMFVLGHNMLLAQEREELLRQGPVIRYATVDSSPQQGWDWVLSGWITVSAQEVQQLFRAALRYIRMCQIRRTREAAGHDADGMRNLDDQISRMRELLSGPLCLQQGMPVAVGSGRADVRYKLHSIVHAEKLISKSWHSTVSMVNAMFSLCGDMGTESRLPFCRINLAELFGRWILPGGHTQDNAVDAAMEFDFQPEPAGAEAAPPAEDAALFDFVPEKGLDVEPPGEPDAAVDPQPDQPDISQLEIDLTSTVYIPGLLHICHNVVKDLTITLHEWQPFESRLRHLCRLLSKKFTRQRLLETCFVEEPLSFFRADFHEFSASVYEGRWGSVSSAVGKLLLLEKPLRLGWNLSKYKFGKPGAHQPRQGEADSHHVDIDAVDGAIACNEFWAYCHMVDVVAESVEVIMRFGESCQCHWSWTAFDGPVRHTPKRLLSEKNARAHGERCPMQGLRAPELAAGALRSLLQDLAQRGQAQLLLATPVARLAPAARTRVFDDFARARRYLAFAFTIKTSFWEQLPWALFAIAHDDVGKARDAACRCLRLYEAAGPDIRQQRLVADCCTPGSIGRRQLAAFRDGAELSALPSLEFLVSRMRFAPVVERWIESRHALAKRVLNMSPVTTALHLAFHLTLPRVRLRLAGGSAEVSRAVHHLAQHCKAVRSAAKALVAVGFWQHPGIQEVFARLPGRRELNTKGRSAVVEVLFHVDGKTLMQPLPMFGQTPPPPPGPRGPPALPPPGPGPTPLLPPSGHGPNPRPAGPAGAGNPDLGSTAPASGNALAEGDNLISEACDTEAENRPDEANLHVGGFGQGLGVVAG